MPRKAFVADLQSAQTADLPKGFSGLKPGEEDGSFNISFKTPGFGSQTVHLQAQVTDVGDYPSAHSYFVYSTSDNAPTFINNLLSDPTIYDGLKVSQLIAKIAKQFDDHTKGSLLNPYRLDSDDDLDVIDIDDDDELEAHPEDDGAASDGYEDYADDFGLEDDFSSQPKLSGGTTNAGLYANDKTRREFNSRIRSDLSKLKAAGFRVSCCTSPFDFARDFYLTVSCRIAKLNISEDALAAWDLTREKYILLMFHFTDGYKTAAEITAEAGYNRSTVSYRVAVSTQRKGPRQDTIDLFSTSHGQSATKNDSHVINGHNSLESVEGALEKFFIDRPMNELMNGRFVNIMRLRQTHNFSWDGAERFCQDHQARGTDSIDIDTSYFRPDPIHWRTKPSLRVDDHFAFGGSDKSFPLIAMEFLLRHLIQCTEFCLVCHTHLDTDFEALKPYVCSKPLCLYQYMALGFGPSIEHEILSQPYVVDLLVSFCYSRAAAQKLEDLPIGMGLGVPDVSYLDQTAALGYGVKAFSTHLPGLFATPANRNDSSTAITGLYDQASHQLLLPDSSENPQLKAGDWVALLFTNLTSSGQPQVMDIHRKIVEAWYPTYRLAPGPDESSLDVATPTPPASANSGAGIAVKVYAFHTKFDDIEKNAQARVICHLLNGLPTVSKMKAALLANRTKSLTQIYTNLSPAALGMLRWIIASNRSCIVAIDDLQSGTVNTKERCNGMPGYMQFRFAQGAPDKEQRFMEAVQSTQARLGNQAPTLWAWHGSDMANWHSIIREGLHFKAMAHGRAYGDGIYNALDANTSLGYSTRGAQDPSIKTGWLSSELNMTSALSLNEIVNAPTEFRSSSPYLVVQHVDWVQTRILFVQCNIENKKALEDVAGTKPDNALEQDHKYSSKGIVGQKLIIPANAISASRRKPAGVVNKGLKKMKLFGLIKNTAEQVEEVFMSEADDDEDLALVSEPLVTPPASSQSKGKAVARISTIKTDFVPGSLDVSKLPTLPLPPFATPQASKALTRCLKDLQKLQNTTPTAELGWHLCEEALDNIYQWIIELHTFDPEVPLHTDLKKKGLTSVVLELRFGPSFPFSPPFVRVVKPRFLGFQQGGGGHVTLGGSLCMELLTNDGWSAVSSIEAVLLQVKMAISSVDPRPARLPSGPVGEYSAGEAIEAYKRACAMHGWTVPPDLLQIGQAGAGIGGSSGYGIDGMRG